MMYQTLQELRDAVADGSLKLHKDDRVIVDNDDIYLYVRTGEDVDDSVKVFEMHPSDFIEQALEILGLPWMDV